LIFSLGEVFWQPKQKHSSFKGEEGMHILPFSNEQVKSRGTLVTGRRVRMAPGVLVQLEPFKCELPKRPRARKATYLTVKPGALCWRNEDLKRETQSATTHHIFDDLYAAERACMAIAFGYGVRPSAEGSELQNLQQFIVNMRESVLTTLAYHVLDDAEKNATRSYIAALALSQQGKRNVRKVTARERLAEMYAMLTQLELEGRGTRTVNRSTIAIHGGAAIRHTQQRMDDAREIYLHIDRRAVLVHEYIVRVIALYKEFWQFLGFPPDFGPEAPKPKLFKPGREREAFQFMVRSLTLYRDAFSKIDVRPFRRNAAHLVEDIDELLVLCKKQEPEGVLDLMHRAAQGTLMIFGLHRLHTEVLTPLSFLFDDLRRRERRDRSGQARGKRTRFIPKRELAPEAFGKIQAAMATMPERFARCTDRGFKKPVMDDVRVLLQKTLDHMAADEWLKAKRTLLKITKIL
jgi:hypothetical protein